MPYRYTKRTGTTQYHHVFNVGAGEKTIFRSSRDYERFITKIKQYLHGNEGVRIVAFCLMPNAYHLVVEELRIGSTARLLHRLSVAYAMYFNARYKEYGHLFRGPYKEDQIESPDQLIGTVNRLHAMPLELRVEPAKYRWSSFADYLSQESSWLYKQPVERYFNDADLGQEMQSGMEQLGPSAA